MLMVRQLSVFFFFLTAAKISSYSNLSIISLYSTSFSSKAVDPDPHSFSPLDPDPHSKCVFTFEKCFFQLQKTFHMVNLKKQLDPDPHLEKQLDPDPQKMNAYP